MQFEGMLRRSNERDKIDSMNGAKVMPIDIGEIPCNGSVTEKIQA